MKYSQEHQEWGQWTIGLLLVLFQIACMFLAGWQQVLLVSISFIPGFIIYYQGVRENNRTMSGSEKGTMVVVLAFSLIAIFLIFNGTIAVG